MELTLMIGLFSNVQVYRSSRTRWINLAFVVALCLLLLTGYLSEDTLSELWPYVALLPFFIVQFLWPTTVGWLLSIGAWLVFAFGVCLFDRLIYDVKAISVEVLVLFGIVPALLLSFCRPRAQIRSDTSNGAGGQA
jgi:hypothetical protein